VASATLGLMREPWEIKMRDEAQRRTERRLAQEVRELHRPKDLQEPGEDDYLLATEDNTGEDV
jgi:hypothetical protein